MTATLTYNPRNRIANATMEYIRSLGVFTIVPQSPVGTKKSARNQDVNPELWSDLMGALHEVKEHYNGKGKLKPVEDLLNEL